jgi:sporulation protein YlmC with PRC-barrel domain
MLRKASDLRGHHLGARDGEIGRVKDFYFDDQDWTVRYLVADTNKWLPGRKVLLSPRGIKQIRQSERVIDFDLTREQIQQSPSIDEHRPVDRQFEVAYHQYYQWPFYWQGTGMWGPMTAPLDDPAQVFPLTEQGASNEDSHLHSASEVYGYGIHAQDGEFGHVEDLIFEEDSWRIRYMVIDTRDWWPGKKVLIAPQWIQKISFPDSEVRVDLLRATIESAPAFDMSGPVTRDYELSLFRHYSKAPYWDQKMAA